MSVEIEVYDGSGPLIMTEILADGLLHDYELSWVRVVPTGLKLTAKHKETGKQKVVLVDEARLMREISEHIVSEMEDQSSSS